MHRKLLLIALLLLLPGSLQAQSRLWRNNNATRSFTGELVKREADKITIKMTTTGKQVVVRPDQLHADDIKWLRENHPLPGEMPATPAAGTIKAKPGAFYDTLAFGDDQATVMKKLKESKVFHTTLNETYFARTGLNGNYRTAKGHEFFGMPASLYFDWDDQGLINASFYGNPIPAAQAETALLPAWQGMIVNISKQFDQPKVASTKPDYASLAEGQITFTHAWSATNGATLLLGVGKQEGEYVIIARFSSEQH